MLEFIEVTDGKTSDITAARRFTFSKGSIIVCDRVVGATRNAVMTQVWIALCTYLLFAFLKFQSKAEKIMQQILRLLEINLFEKRELFTFLRGDPPVNKDTNSKQVVFW